MTRKAKDQKIERFVKGAKSLKERHLNSIVDGINRLSTGVDAPRQPKPRGRAGGSPVITLTLVTQEDDYLVCQDEDANEILVAKPWLLRRTPFDGETVDGVTYIYTSASERLATSGDSSVLDETQYITPNYFVDCVVYAIRPQGGTGITENDSQAAPVVYLEMNQGRAWAWDEEV